MVELSDQFGGPYFTKGGQGKLFRDPKPVDQHRYQRGYTPERMADVNDATWRGLHGPGELQAHFRQTVARSTMPLEGLREQVGNVNLSRGREQGAGTLGNHEVSYGAFSGMSASKINIFHGAHTKRNDPLGLSRMQNAFSLRTDGCSCHP